MKQITSLVATFSNGDQLSLELKDSQFAGYKKAPYYELVYGERHEGEYGDDVATEGKHHFMATGTEYFAKSDVNMAITAFGLRVDSSTPAKATTMGKSVDDVLERDLESSIPAGGLGELLRARFGKVQ